MAKKKENDAIGLDVELSKSEAFIEKNLKPLLIAVGVVIIAAVCYFIYSNHMEDVEAQAEKAIAKSQVAFSQEQYEIALNGDVATGQKGFLKIAKEFSGTKTANLAKLYAALCYASTEKYDKAIEYFEDFSKKDDQMISPMSTAALANCYVHKGQKDKGAEMLVKAAKDADNNTVSPICLLQAGEIYESLNQSDKAVELYKEIKTKYFRSAVANDIDKYIERATK